LPEHSHQLSLRSNLALQLDEPSMDNCALQLGETFNNGYISNFGEAYDTQTTGNHPERISTLWGRHSCDADYDFTLNELPHSITNLHQPPLPEAFDHHDFVLNNSASRSLDSRHLTPEGSDDCEWVHITPQCSGESAESNGSSESSSRDSSPSEERNEPLPGPQPQQSGNPWKSASSEPARSLQLLAPKRAPVSAFGSQYVASQPNLEEIDASLLDLVELDAFISMSGKGLDGRAKKKNKKRSAYIDKRIRNETFLTRQIKACVRCRMQRNRV
jgi:hypothetical protein